MKVVKSQLRKKPSPGGSKAWMSIALIGPIAGPPINRTGPPIERTGPLIQTHDLSEVGLC